MQESFEEFGQPEVIAISPSNEVYNGHQRLKSWFAKFGDIEVDVRVSDRALTEKERERLTVLLHRGAVGEWDFETLANEFDVGELLEWGFTEMELGLDGAAAGNADAEPQIDRAAELNEKWQVQPGDLWRIGEHRIICGDCTDAAVVERVMGGERAALCFTSPPYNAGKTPTEEKMGVSSKYVDNSDDLGQEDYFSLLQKSTEAALLCCDYVAVNLQMLAGNKGAFIEWLHVNKPRIADVIIWDKQRAQPAMAENVLNSQFEFVWVLSQKGTRAIGTRQFRGTVSNVYSGSPQTQNEFAGAHSATFPVHFPEHFINALTNGGDLVLEPFNGSGTTLIACENLGRRCRAVEISPGYVAVALERMSVAFAGIVIERVE